jgi:hypothetical protein
MEQNQRSNPNEANQYRIRFAEIEVSSTAATAVIS